MPTRSWAVQSHLYGIESLFGAASQSEANRFNRTFMELKAPREGIPPHHAVRFNRTFMELKVQFVVSSAEDSMVQSHLYSCESLRVGYGEGKYRCFNRTFMELKERNAFGLTLTPCVSIAPLWN